MGRCKATLRHATGVNFLQLAAGRLDKVCDSVICSLAADQQDLVAFVPHSTTIVWDSQSDLGPAQGVLEAMRVAIASHCDALLVTPVDCPDLRVSHLQKLAAAWKKQPDKIVCAIGERDTRHQPLIAIYPGTYVDRIETLVASGRRSLYHLLVDQAANTLALSDPAIKNFNEPEDLLG